MKEWLVFLILSSDCSVSPMQHGWGSAWRISRSIESGYNGVDLYSHSPIPHTICPSLRKRWGESLWHIPCPDSKVLLGDSLQWGNWSDAWYQAIWVFDFFHKLEHKMISSDTWGINACRDWKHDGGCKSHAARDYSEGIIEYCINCRGMTTMGQCRLLRGDDYGTKQGHHILLQSTPGRGLMCGGCKIGGYLRKWYSQHLEAWRWVLVSCSQRLVWGHHWIPYWLLRCHDYGTRQGQHILQRSTPGQGLMCGGCKIGTLTGTS